MSCKLSPAFLNIFLLLLATTICAAQQVDAGAQVLIAKSHAAFSGGKPVGSVTMSGTASWHYGSDQQTGTVQLTANADGSSRLELHLAKGTRIETQSAFNADPKCVVTDFDGLDHKVASTNCFVSALWALPILGMQAATISKDLSVQTDGNRLLLSRAFALDSKETSDLLRKVTAAQIELDPQSGLPLKLSFNLHPENDALRNIPVDIRYSDYSEVQGVQVPFRIQKYLNGGLVLDLTLTSGTAQLASLTAPVTQ